MPGAIGEERGVDMSMIGGVRVGQRSASGLVGEVRTGGGIWRHDDSGAMLGGLGNGGGLRTELSGGVGMLVGMGGTDGEMVGGGVGLHPQESLQTLAAVAAAAGRRKLRRGPDGKFEPKTNILARAQGRFANPYGISQADLTESMIRPLMRFCQDTAAEALKVSKNTLSKACKRLQLTWPARPQVPTTERQKANMRKKSRNNKVPKNSILFCYCEKEEEDAVRFHEVRLSADSCTVFQRWGRTNKQVYRANKKIRYNSKDEAIAYCNSLRTEQFNPGKGWVDKAAPALPKVHSKQSKSKKAMKKMCVASKKDAVILQQNTIFKMKAEMKLDKNAHTESALQVRSRVKRISRIRVNGDKAVKCGMRKQRERGQNGH